MEGYPVRLSFFIKGQGTFITLGMSNKIVYNSLSGPTVVTTSCLKNLVVPQITEKWFGMIIHEAGCKMNSALQNITDLGASAAFYYNKAWTHDIFSMQTKNIAIDDVTYHNIIRQGVVETGIEPVQAQADSLMLVFTFMLFCFGFYTIISWLCKKCKRSKKNYLTSYYGGRDGDESCTICIEEFKTGEMVRTLQCNHIFHEKCIGEWFEKKEVCPNCNQPLLQ